MNEHDWLNGPDGGAHVRFAAGHLSPRRQRLLAVALCRTAVGSVGQPDLTAALDVIDRYADDPVASGPLERARQECRTIAQQSFDVYRKATDTGADPGNARVRSELAWAVSFAASSPLPLELVGTRVLEAVGQTRADYGGVLRDMSPAFRAAVEAHLSVVRETAWEVAGNPFRPIHFAPEWRTDTVRALAQQMYDAREFSAMPILADALQDAGCDSDSILDHCRGERAHVRGCWVLDLVLGLD